MQTKIEKRPGGETAYATAMQEWATANSVEDMVVVVSRTKVLLRPMRTNEKLKLQSKAAAEG